MNFIVDDTICVPVGATDDFDSFRRWTKSASYPERGEVAFLNGDLWVDSSMETWLHNQLKSAITVVLGNLVMTAALGRVFGDRMRLVHEDALLSTEPDAMFVSSEAIKARRVRFEEGTDSLEVIGTPDMVLEVVSKHSIQKDTVVLRELYAAAGIAEYWLVNPLGGQLSFEILRLTARGYAAARKTNGWTKSAVFNRSFRLEPQESDDELPDYRLLVR